MGRFIFVSFGLLVVFLSLSGAKGNNCPQDWLPMNGLCYKIFDELKAWKDAEMFCRKYKPGCHLASFHLYGESPEIAEYISDYHKGQSEVWIGLWDKKKDFSWEWTDRSCTDYLSWDKNQPDHYQNKEFCVELVSDTGLEMFLITCFILGLLGSLTWAGPSVRTVCPSGTFADKDRSQWYCYKFYEDPLTFYQAEEECQFIWNGHLASLTKNYQVRSIGAYVSKKSLQYTGNYIWIGLRAERDEESNVKIEWSWTDGTPSTYKRWSSDKPNKPTYDESCVSLSPESGYVKWVARECTNTFPFLCKWKPS